MEQNEQLIGSNALGKVLELIHTDQQRQDSATESLSDSMPTGIAVEEIAEIWNNL